MELVLDRRWKKEEYTIGNLYVDGVFFCNTIEDKDRGLDQKLPLAVNTSKKRYGVTAIPKGRYRVTLDVQSPRFSKMKSYAWCNGYLPRLINTPAFDGVLIHAGNSASHSAGCLLVGENKKKGMVLNSMNTLKKLYAKLKEEKGYIYITIK